MILLCAEKENHCTPSFAYHQGIPCPAAALGEQISNLEREQVPVFGCYWITENSRDLSGIAQCSSQQ